MLWTKRRHEDEFGKTAQHPRHPVRKRIVDTDRSVVMVVVSWGALGPGGCGGINGIRKTQ